MPELSQCLLIIKFTLQALLILMILLTVLLMNTCLFRLNYDLDLRGKNLANYRQALSQEKASSIMDFGDLFHA